MSEMPDVNASTTEREEARWIAEQQAAMPEIEPGDIELERVRNARQPGDVQVDLSLADRLDERVDELP